MSFKNALKESFQAARKLKNLIFFYSAAHIVFLIFGQWAVAKKIPSALLIREEHLKEIQNLAYLKPLTGVLANSLALKILYTFFFNLIFGAFLSTTITGAVFFLPYLIAVWRSFIVGVLFYGQTVNLGATAVFYGTFILEFGGYCLSSAVGTDIGLSILWPSRKGTKSRKVAFMKAIKNGAWLYVLVISVLIVAAIWEISWLEYMGPFIKPDNISK